MEDTVSREKFDLRLHEMALQTAPGRSFHPN
jgi:hypothetical protein